MCPQLIVKTALIAFAEEIKVGFAKGGEKRIRVTGTFSLATVVGNNQIIGIDPVGVPGRAFKHICIVDAGEFKSRFILIGGRLKFDPLRLGREHPSNQTGAIPQGMQAQNVMGRAVTQLHQAPKFVL